MTSGGKSRPPLMMTRPPLDLGLAPAGIEVLPHLGASLERVALQLEEQAAWARSVLSNVAAHRVRGLFSTERTGVTSLDVLSVLGTVTGSILLALGGLCHRRIRLRGRLRPRRSLGAFSDGLQSGIVNDYMA